MRWLALLFLVGCVDDPASRPGPRIESITPDPVDPGATLTIEGEAFGPLARGSVAVGGRPARVSLWGESRIILAVPEDAPGGATLVVVTAGGQPSAPEPIFVTGDQGPVEGPRRFPAGRDGGGPPPPRDGGVRDVGPDASRSLVAVYQSDPAQQEDLRLVQVADEPGFLTLQVQGPIGLWGFAYHLVYDRNLLRFDRVVSPGLDARHHGATIVPGRFALGRVLDDARDPALGTLRFRVVGRGEGRVDFPRRHRQARIAPDRPAPGLRWIGGSVRISEVAP